VTLEVENAISVGGIAGCNYYGAELVVAGAALNITPGPMTAMLCQRGDVMDLESRFIAALDTATSWSVDANRLVLGGPNVELAFNRTVPIDLSQIEGKEWVAVGLVPENGAVMPAVLGATLVLKNGSITGSTGCRTFAGTYMVNTGRFEVGSFAMDGECPQNGRGQDDHIVGVLGDGFSPQIADGNLVLSGRFATGLVYEPAAP
jgi:heat shock protein HslJ